MANKDVPPGLSGRRAKGQQMEAVAARYLQSKGVRILDRNVHSRGGELDLIGEQDGVLILFEVRYRKGSGQVSAEESISPLKQQRLLRAAQVYIHRNRLWHRPSRIDVVAISPGLLSRYRIHWIKNAIQA